MHAEKQKKDAIETQISGCRLRRIIIGMWGTGEIRANRTAFRDDRGKSARVKMKRHQLDSTRLIPTSIRSYNIQTLLIIVFAVRDGLTYSHRSIYS